MGSCLSKKTTICSSSTTALPDPPDQKPNPAEKKKSEEDNVKKETFLIKHRITYDSEDRKSDEEKPKSDPKCASTQNSTPGTITTSTSEAAYVGSNFVIGGGGVVRTSSCSKEEIDAILIQCGRFSRSSSTGKSVGGCSGDRKCSGSKRSYDFDHEKGNDNDNDDDDVINDGNEVGAERTHRHRQRHRQSSPSSSYSGRRRTPSRERDQQNQRSGSRERGSGGGGGEGRRVSRSPGKRSESPIITNATRPGKMVSVPATISSMSMDKSGIGAGGGVEPPTAASIKRNFVKRNVGAAASPRARSPAATRISNEKQNSSQTNQPLSLSRSNSRKAENSPYRRNPLGEIDQNCIGVEVPINKASTNIVSQAPIQKPNTDNVRSKKNIAQGTENKTISGRAKEEQQQQKMEDEGKPLHSNTRNVTVTMVPSDLRPQTVTGTRSLRLSRDLDFNPETLLNPSPTSYTALLLEDIQNFHQKGTPGMSLPPCLTKACSILEAVADLNSTTISNQSTVEQFGKKKRLEETKEPFMDSEVIGGDDLMEPSFHMHVTVSGGGGGGRDMEEVESSGSNSFIGGGQNWISSSLWESNSADSTDTWNPLRLGEEKREGDQKHNGIGRGRFGSGRGLQSTTLKAASS